MACATVDTPVILVEGTKEAPTIRPYRGGSTPGNVNGSGKRNSPARGRKTYNGNTQNNGNKAPNQINSNSFNNKSNHNKNNNNTNNNNSNNYNGNKQGQKNGGGYYKQKNGSGNGRQYNKQNSKNSNRQSSLGKEQVAEATAVAAAAVAAVTSAVAKTSQKDGTKNNKKVVEVSTVKKDNKKQGVKEVITKKAMDEMNGKSRVDSKRGSSVASDESESYKSQQELHERFEPVKRELPKITPRSAQSALASFFWNHSVLFQGLEHAKIVGWESSELDTVFSKSPAGKVGACTRSNSMPSLGSSQRMNLIPGQVKPSPQRLTGNTKLNKNTAEMRFIMQAVMKELDEAVDGCLTEAIAGGGTFFDVCAAPGGFSAYLLESAPEATGMGVTLSPEKGGHAMAIPNSSRYWCRHADVLEDPSEILFCKPSHKAPYVPVEFQNIPMDSEGASTDTTGFNVDRFFSSAGETCPKPHLCDLVILDGHYLNGNNSKPLLDRSQSLDITSEILAPPACSLMNLVSKETEHATKSMWISQFIIAVQNLKQGGTLVFRSSTKPDLVQIAMLCLVARLFKGKIRPVKPTVCHMMRSSFYVVCQGFDLEMCAQLQVFPKMLFLWSQMKQKDPGSLPIWHPIDKLSEFTTPDNFINTWGPALINFFEPIWKFQTLALNAMIQDCSTNSPRSPKSNGCKSKMCFYHKLGQCKRGNGQCWYAHDTDELHPEIRKACAVRFMPLVSPWFPPNTSKII